MFKLYLRFFLIIILLSNCSNEKVEKQVIQEETNKMENQFPLIPINYDFNNLNLYLNASINNIPSKGFWNWDHMNGGFAPDSIGIDYYENREQASFFFEGEETLPALSVKTKRNKLIEFYATILFDLEDKGNVTINSLFDSLVTIDLLKKEQVREQLIETRIYKNETDHIIEAIELKLSPEGYDRIIYSIKNKTIQKDTSHN